jgi:hypothetical protein
MAVDTTSGTAHQSAAEAAATSSRVDTTSGTAQESAAEAAAAADSATPGQKETTAERRRKQAKEKANAENKKKDIAARITKYKLVRPNGRSVIWDYFAKYSNAAPMTFRHLAVCKLCIANGDYIELNMGSSQTLFKARLCLLLVIRGPAVARRTSELRTTGSARNGGCTC